MPVKDIRVRQPVHLPDPFTSRYWMPPGQQGVDAFDPYVETYWVSAVGPTTYLLARRLLLEPQEWSKAHLAAAIGVGYRGGQNCPLERAMTRLVRFNLGTTEEETGVLYVRPRWPRLAPGNVARLPKNMRESEPEDYRRALLR